MQNEETHFVEFAAQGSQCSAAHAAFVKENSGTIIWLSDLKKVSKTNKQRYQYTHSLPSLFLNLV